MSKDAVPNGVHRISELDGKAPDSTGGSDTSIGIPMHCLVAGLHG